MSNKNKNYFIYLSIILFIVNNIMVSINKVSGDILDNFFYQYLMIAFISVCTGFSIYVLNIIKKTYLDIDEELKQRKRYIYTLTIILSVYLIIESLLRYSKIINCFLPFIVRLVLFIGYILPLLYECYILNKKYYKEYIMGLFVLYIIVFGLMIFRLSPIYKCLSLILLFISFMFCIYKYNQSLLKNRWFIVSMIILLIHCIIGVIYISQGNYIADRIQDYMIPEVDTGYHYIRELLADSQFIGKSTYMNKVMLEEIDFYGLVGSSILYRFGWLLLFLYLLLHYIIIKVSIPLIKQFINDKNILLIILLTYIWIQLICSMTGTLGLPILNITSPFVDARNDLFIVLIIVCMGNLLEQDS